MTIRSASQRAALAALGFLLILPFSDSAFSFWNARMDVFPSTPPGAVPLRVFEPPARRAILVDREGQAQPTADRIWMTKRDRSRMKLVEGFSERRDVPVYVYPDPNDVPVAVRGAKTAERAPEDRRFELDTADSGPGR